MKLKTIFYILLACLFLLSATTLLTVLFKHSSNKQQDRIQAASAKMMNTLVQDDIADDFTNVSNIWRKQAQHIAQTLDSIQDDIDPDTYHKIKTQIQAINEITSEIAIAPELTMSRALRYQIYAATLTQSIFALQQKTSSVAKHDLMKLSSVLIILSAALPLLILIILFYTNKWLFPFINDLTQAAQKMTNGDFSQPIAIIRNDEIGTLAAAMEYMRQSLIRNEIIIKAKNDEIEAFVYAVSHDLRGPLVNLVGFTHEISLSMVAIKQQNTPLSKEQAKDLEISIKFICDNAKKLETLIDGLLRLSRTGRQDLNPEIVNTKESIEASLNEFQHLIADCKATIHIDALPSIFIDSEAFNRVISNLVSNAIKYRSPDRPLHIQIAGSYDEAEDMVRLSITDNGLGFPESSKNKLFQVFQRFHPHTAAGEGMGLLIIKRLIERSYGSISMTNNSEHGCTATISFKPAPVSSADRETDFDESQDSSVEVVSPVS